MKFCPNCGSDVKDEAKFCPKCGSSIHSGSAVKDTDGTSNNAKNSSSNNNILIVAVAAIICVAIIAAALIVVGSNDSDSDVVIVDGSGSDDSVDESSSSDSSKSDSSSSSSSSSSNSITYSQAQSMYPDSSSNVISNAFDEADSNGDGILTGSEVSEFKRLAKLATETASDSKSTTYNEHGSITRYCTTHGRVTTGEDLLCPYCKAEGLDARTVKGSTEYN